MPYRGFALNTHIFIIVIYLEHGLGGILNLPYDNSRNLYRVRDLFVIAD
jgi:hypothetical protein